MAFLGPGNGDAQCQALKRLVAQKDQQLTTVMNEHHKKNEAFEDLKRAKEEATLRYQKEAAKAVKAENFLASKISELQRANIRIDNLESSLVAANDKIKEGEKELRQTQFALETSHGASSTNLARLQKDHSALQARCRDLEFELRRADRDKENQQSRSYPHSSAESQELQELRKEVSRLRSAAQGVGTPGRGLKVIGANTPNPSPRVRKAASFSIPSSGRAEAEVDTLKGQLQAASTELESAKSSLAKEKREVMKMENEKLALERKAAREVEGLKERLDEAEEELGFYRRSGSGKPGDDGGEIRQEKLKLEEQVTALEKGMQEKLAEISRLEEQVQLLEGKLRESETGANSREGALASQLQALEKQLKDAQASARSTPEQRTTTAGPEADKAIRQLQRDLAASKREREALEENLRETDDLLAAKESELAQLTANAGVASHSSRSSGELEHERLALKETEMELRQQVAKLELDISSKDKQLQHACAELQSTKDDLASVRLNFDNLQVEHQSSTTTRDASTQELNDLKTAHEESCKAVTRLTAELEYLQNAHATLQAELRTSLDTLQAKSAELASAQETVSATVSERDGLLSRQNELENSLANHARSTAESDALISERDSLIGQLGDKELALKDAQTMEFGAQKLLEASREAVTDLRAEVDALQRDIKTRSDQAEEQKETMLLQNEVLERKASALEEQLQELQAAAADRSTESEAQQREIDVIRLRSEKEELLQEIETGRAEIETLENILAENDRSAVDREAELKKRLQAAHAQVVKARTEKGALEAAQAELQVALDQERTRKDELIRTMVTLPESPRETPPRPRDHTAELARTEAVMIELFAESCEQQRMLAFAEMERLAAAEASEIQHDKLTVEYQRVNTLRQHTQDRLSELEAALSAASETAQGFATETQGEIATLRSKLEQRQKDLETAEISLQGALESCRLADRRFQETNAVVVRKETEIQDLIRQNGSLQAANRLSKLPADTRASAMAQQIADLESRVLRRNAFLAAEQTRARNAEFQLEQAHISLSEQDQRIGRLEGERDQLLSESSESEQTAKQLRDRISQLLDDLAKLNAEHAQAGIQSSDQMIRGENAIQYLVLELARGVASSNRLRSTLRFQAAELATCKERLFASKAALSEMEARLSTMVREREAAVQAIAEADAAKQEELRQVRGQLASLSQVVASRAAERDILDEQCKKLSSDLAAHRKQSASENTDHEDELVKLRAAVADAESRRTTQQADLDAAQAERDQCRRDLEEINEKLATKDALATSRDLQLQEKTEEILHLSATVQEHRQESETSSAAIAALQHERLVAHRHLEDLRSQIAAQEDLAASLRLQNAAAKGSELRLGQEVRDLEARLSESQADTAQASVRREAEKAKLEEAARHLDALLNDVELAKSTENALRSQLATEGQEAEARINETRDRANEAEREMADLAHVVEITKIRVAELEEALESTSRKSEQLQASLGHAENELRSTTALLQESDGACTELKTLAAENQVRLKAAEERRQLVEKQLQAAHEEAAALQESFKAAREEQVSAMEALKSVTGLVPTESQDLNRHLEALMNENAEHVDAHRQVLKEKGKLEKTILKQERKIKVLTASIQTLEAAAAAPPQAAVEPSSTPAKAERPIASLPTHTPKGPSGLAPISGHKRGREIAPSNENVLRGRDAIFYSNKVDSTPAKTPTAKAFAKPLLSLSQNSPAPSQLRPTDRRALFGTSGLAN